MDTTPLSVNDLDINDWETLSVIFSQLESSEANLFQDIEHYESSTENGEDYDSCEVNLVSELYQNCIQQSLKAMALISPRQNKFSAEDLLKKEKKDIRRTNDRYILSDPHGYFNIFPWVCYISRIKQTEMKKKSGRYQIRLTNDEESLSKLLQSMDYFYMSAYPYSEQDLIFLKNLYEELEWGKGREKSIFLNIIQVAQALRSFRKATQEIVPLLSKKRRIQHNGGDRACWYKIRPDDLQTRNQWYLPGEVFGLYPDGVGPLRNNHQLPNSEKFRSVVVYSVAPDIVEEHPDPTNSSHYVRVVMVGEAPIRLSQYQYQKFQRLKGICNLYVNQHGEVCVRSMSKCDPPNGFVFARVQWHENICNDSPIFQDVPGVCAQITSACPSIVAAHPTTNILHICSQLFNLSLWKAKYDLLRRRDEKLSSQISSPDMSIWEQEVEIERLKMMKEFVKVRKSLSKLKILNIFRGALLLFLLVGFFLISWNSTPQQCLTHSRWIVVV